MTNRSSALVVAIVLGVLALLPFAAGVYYGYAGSRLDARDALVWLWPYLATIVGFTGGVQWGRMLAQARAPALDMTLAVLPALVAWGGLLLDSPWRGITLTFALLAAWLIDEHGARRGWQSRGFLQLRRLLTLAVFVAVILLLWRSIRG